MVEKRGAQIPKTSVLKRDASVLTSIILASFVRFLAQIAQISTDDSADLCSDLSLLSSRFNTSKHRCTDRSQSNRNFHKKEPKRPVIHRPKEENTEYPEQLENICAICADPNSGQVQHA